MAKVRPQCRIALDAAHLALAEANVRHPRDINVPAIAAKNGAVIVYGQVATSRSSIVSAGGRAIILVDEKARGTSSECLTIGHELGHKKLHPLVDHFMQCEPDGEKRSGKDWRMEAQAYDFGRALAAPAFLAAPYCTAPRPTLEHVERLARIFPLSLEASVIRFVQLADVAGIACAGALTKPDGHVKWATETHAFPGKIVKDHALHEASFASRVHARRKDRGGHPREVPGEAWGGTAPFLEQSIYMPATGGVLSWIVPAI